MKSGIYKIINPSNDKIYIGSAINIEKRFIKHLERLSKNQHHNIHLQRAFNIRDKDFIYEVIEFCEIEKLLEREQFYIDNLKPDYNISPTAYSSLGIIRRQETKDKIRDTLTGRKQSQETINKKIAKLTGIKHSDEARLKASERQKGNNNSLIKSGKGFDKQIEAMRIANISRSPSKETRDKIAKTLSKPIIQLTMNNKFIREWNSAKEVENKLGFANSLINRICSGKVNKQGHINKSAYGFKWQYKIDYENNKENNNTRTITDSGN